MNSKDAIKTFTATGNYFVTLTATSPGGCKDDYREDFVITDDCGVFIPSAFTPNKDGLNDLFIPVVTGFKSITRFSVYNRFGNLVFTTHKAGEGWDGKYKGLLQPAGTFVWVLEYINRDDKPVMYKGTVTLIR
jgi:gliding motility-associated-like protein